MKLYLASANVVAVTNLMLSHGTGEDKTLVPAKALSFRAEIDPKLLDELREGLADLFFEPSNGKGPRVPSIPEIDGAIGWKTEYEGGTLKLDLGQLDDLDFDDEELVCTGVDTKAISFEPLATGRAIFKCNAIVTSDDPEMRGKLDALLRHDLPVTFTKLTQKPLAAPKKAGDDAAESRQGALIDAPATQH
jgi:hypothetical protein